MTNATPDPLLWVVLTVVIGLAWLAGTVAVVFAVITVFISRRRRRK